MEIIDYHYADDHKKHMSSDNTHNINNKLYNRCVCLDYDISPVTNEFIFDEMTEFKRCRNRALNNSNTCKKHVDCKKFMALFTNGYELDFEPTIWNSNVFVQGSHNCYAYFLNQKPNRALVEKCNEICSGDADCALHKFRKCKQLIPQPGDYILVKNNNLKNKNYKNYTCKQMIKRIKADTPDIKKTKLTKKCPKNTYKGSMVIDTNETFHFYRLNSDGSWSHKPGISPLTDKDASGDDILVPHFADRNYHRSKTSNSTINYDAVCGYFCIPTDKKPKYMI